MEFEIMSIEKAISEIGQILRIEKFTAFSEDSIKDVLLKLTRNAKWDGVINSGNWIAKSNTETGKRSLTIKKQ